MYIEIIRTYDNKKQTEGVLYLMKNNKILFECFTIELPWKNNQKRISCIPTGIYTAIKHNSPKLGPSLWLQNVKNRSEILIHRGNYSSQILGCIILGNSLHDINNDGLLDVTNSIQTLNKLLSLIPNTIEVHIKYRI